MIRVGVVGAAGRVGAEMVAAVREADDLQLVAQIDPTLERLEAIDGVSNLASTDGLDGGDVDVLIDFTVADAVRTQLAPALRRGISVVVGTTGLTGEDLDALRSAADEGGAGALYAANFALGAVLLMRFAAEAARYFDGVEIIELHHDKKVDAPSGTALSTAATIAQARDEAGMEEPHDPTTTVLADGARGGRGPGGIHIHSVRLPGLIAHEEVIFGGLGQTLTLRHDSYDRRSFVPGVLLAVRAVQSRPGLTVGLAALLDS